LTNFTFLL